MDKFKYIYRGVARIMEKYRHKLFLGSGDAQGGPWGKAPGSSQVIQQKW
jgi:hypothetical protein